MEALQHIIQGFGSATQPLNLAFCFIGVLIGTFVGVLPGIGPVTGIALLLPMSYGMNPVSAIILLSGIYYGTMYGGTITSVLLCIPGEPASVVTCFDGYQMALQGRAGPALGIAAFGSFIGGSIAILGMAAIAPPLARFALKFGPVETFSIMALGITLVTYVSRFSVRKAIIVAAFGIIIASVGQDFLTGVRRLTFGFSGLQEGVGLIPVVMGLYGVSEILANAEKTLDLDVFKEKIKNILPSRADWRRSFLPISRGTAIGFFLGLIPGAGPTVSTFVSYGIEKKLSKHPERFGKGAIEGVAAPETANNAAAQAAFIPLLTLGIPSTATIAILYGALMIQGVTPGPMLISKHPELFWALTASMWVGNIMLVILNVPLIGIWVKLLRIPYHYLAPNIMLFCIIGAYCIRNTFVDVLIMLVFGVIGYLMNKFDYEPAPIAMMLVLGPRLEETFKQSLIMSGGSFGIFFSTTISVVSLGIALFLLMTPLFTKKKLALGAD
jgi:putative tricarboxylic transport membrane protein